MYRMNGMSFREFIEVTQDVALRSFKLDEILSSTWETNERSKPI